MDSNRPPAVRYQHQKSTRTILLVEDQFDIRWSAAEFLRLASFRILEAVNMPEAISIVDSGIHIDAVFSDINMPGGENGYALAYWLLQRRPTMPVLLTSGQCVDPAFCPTPTRQFVRKPYELSQVDKLLHSMLD